MLRLVSDVRRCEVRVRDGLYVRLVERGRGAGGAAYRTPVDVVLEVEDAFCPWNEGRWRLTADAKGAVTCRSAPPMSPNWPSPCSDWAPPTWAVCP